MMDVDHSCPAARGDAGEGIVRVATSALIPETQLSSAPGEALPVEQKSSPQDMSLMFQRHASQGPALASQTTATEQAVVLPRDLDSDVMQDEAQVDDVSNVTEVTKDRPAVDGDVNSVGDGFQKTNETELDLETSETSHLNVFADSSFQDVSLEGEESFLEVEINGVELPPSSTADDDITSSLLPTWWWPRYWYSWLAPGAGAFSTSTFGISTSVSHLKGHSLGGSPVSAGTLSARSQRRAQSVACVLPHPDGAGEKPEEERGKSLCQIRGHVQARYRSYPWGSAIRTSPGEVPTSRMPQLHRNQRLYGLFGRRSPNYGSPARAACYDKNLVKSDTTAAARETLPLKIGSDRKVEIPPPQNATKPGKGADEGQNGGMWVIGVRLRHTITRFLRLLVQHVRHALTSLLACGGSPESRDKGGQVRVQESSESGWQSKDDLVTVMTDRPHGDVFSHCRV